MTRIVSGVLLAVVTLVGTPAVAPVLSSSVIYAEVSDEQLMDELLNFEIAEREIPQPGTGEVNEAYARMMSGKAEFRVVLTMEARHGHHAPRR